MDVLMRLKKYVVGTGWPVRKTERVEYSIQGINHLQGALLQLPEGALRERVRQALLAYERLVRVSHGPLDPAEKGAALADSLCAAFDTLQELLPGVAQRHPELVPPVQATLAELLQLSEAQAYQILPLVSVAPASLASLQQLLRVLQHSNTTPIKIRFLSLKRKELISQAYSLTPGCLLALAVAVSAEHRRYQHIFAPGGLSQEDAQLFDRFVLGLVRTWLGRVPRHRAAAVWDSLRQDRPELRAQRVAPAGYALLLRGISAYLEEPATPAAVSPGRPGAKVFML